MPVPEVSKPLQEKQENEEEQANQDWEQQNAEEKLVPRKRPAKTPLRRQEKRARVDGDEDDVGPAGLLPGLGTMFQPTVDWLSEEKASYFAHWRHEVMEAMASSV